MMSSPLLTAIAKKLIRWYEWTRKEFGLLTIWIERRGTRERRVCWDVKTQVAEARSCISNVLNSSTLKYSIFSVCEYAVACHYSQWACLVGLSATQLLSQAIFREERHVVFPQVNQRAALLIEPGLPWAVPRGFWVLWKTQMSQVWGLWISINTKEMECWALQNQVAVL